MILRLFRAAGATGHVFLMKAGVPKDKGLAYSGLIGPMTTVAVIPTTARIINFSVEARTQDKQAVTVTGNVKVTLMPETAISKFDFTVNPKTGAFQSQWEQELQEIVVERVLGPIRDKVGGLNVESAIQSERSVEQAVMAGIAAGDNPLQKKGVILESCSIVTVETEDDVEQAIGSKERQAMLTEADKALHTRRLKAAENERGVRTYESETALRLEEERAKLVEKQGENKKKEATADAEATKLRLEPFASVDPGKVLGASIMKMAERGVGNLSIVPELLTALGQTGKK